MHVVGDRGTVLHLSYSFLTLFECGISKVTDIGLNNFP